MKSGFGRKHGSAAASVDGSTKRGTKQQQLVAARVADIKEVKEQLEGGKFEGFDDDWFHGGQKQSAFGADAGEGLIHCPNALTALANSEGERERERDEKRCHHFSISRIIGID